MVGLEREGAVPTSEHGHEQASAGVRPLEAFGIIDAVLDDDEVVALFSISLLVNVVFSWSISRRALSAAAALSACAAASLTRLDARHIFAFVSSARRLASRCVATLWRSVLARRRASRVCIAWRCFFYGTLTWRRSSSCYDSSRVAGVSPKHSASLLWRCVASRTAYGAVQMPTRRSGPDSTKPPTRLRWPSSEPHTRILSTQMQTDVLNASVH